MKRGGPTVMALCACWMLLDSSARGQPTTAESRTLAVLPAVCVGDFDLSEQATGEIRREFVALGKFQLVERERIADVMREISLGYKRDFDPEMAVEVGKLLAAHYVCFASVTNPSVSRTTVERHTSLRAYVTMSLRLVSVRSGRTLFEDTHTDTYQGWQNSTTEPALLGSATRLAAGELVKRLDRTVLTEGIVVAIRDRKELLIDVGTELGVRKGQRFLVYRAGASIQRPDGTSVRSPDELIGEVEVVRAGDESAVVKRVGGGQPAIGDRVVEKAKKKGFADW